MPRLLEFDDKAPIEDRRFELDWSDVIIPSNTITSIEVTASPSGLTIASNVVNGMYTSVKIGGGAEGDSFETYWKMTDNAGNIYEQTVKLRIRRKT